MSPQAIKESDSADTELRKLKQLPGCLPKGFTLDSMLTPQQFCLWQQIGEDWFWDRRGSLPGVVSRSRKMVRIHPRTFLEGTVRKAA